MIPSPVGPSSYTNRPLHQVCIGQPCNVVPCQGDHLAFAHCLLFSIVRHNFGSTSTTSASYPTSMRPLPTIPHTLAGASAVHEAI